MKITEQVELKVMADGSLTFNLVSENLILEGTLPSAAALNITQQILELHEARQALLDKKKKETG